MKILSLLILVVVLSACSEKQMEEFAFRKTLEYQLTDLCGEDEACIAAVKDQTRACMEKSDWYKYVSDQDNQAELDRFTTAFYACLVDPDGNPYFLNKPAAGEDKST
jgi:hypothetical protein